MLLNTCYNMREVKYIYSLEESLHLLTTLTFPLLLLLLLATATASAETPESKTWLLTRREGG